MFFEQLKQDSIKIAVTVDCYCDKMLITNTPTAALDYTTSIEVLSVMENVVKSGTTLIIVTHNEEIAKMADRVVRFRDGKTYEVRVNAHPLHAADLVW